MVDQAGRIEHLNQVPDVGDNLAGFLFVLQETAVYLRHAAEFSHGSRGFIVVAD